MLIRSMNSIFSRHGKVLFTIATIIIVIAFVGIMTPSFTGLFDRMGAAAAGKIFGEKVKPAELQEQANFNYLVMCLTMPSVPREAIMKYSYENQFNLLASYKATEQLNIVVSNEQVAEALKTFFSIDGKFSQEAFDLFMKREVKPLGLTQGDFEEALRRNIAISEMNAMIREGVITTPGEVEEFYKKLKQTNVVRTADFLAVDYVDAVKLTPENIEGVEQLVFNPEKKQYEQKIGNLVMDKALWAYFNANSAQYASPVERKGLLLEFKFKTPQNIAEAEKAAATEANLKQYFEENIGKYQSGNDKADFAKVKAAVKTDFINSYIKDLAVNTARRFAGGVLAKIDELEDNSPAAIQSLIMAAIQEYKPIVKPIGPVATYDKSAGGVDNAQFVDGFIQSFHPITQDVVGKEGVYVGFVTESQERNWWELPAYLQRVTNDYKLEQAMKIAQTEATTLSKELNQLPMEKIAAQIGKIQKPVFSASRNLVAEKIMGKRLDQLAYAMIEGVPAGKVSNAQAIPGGMTVVYLERVIPADMKDWDKNKEFYQELWRQQKVMAQLNDFNAWLSSNCSEYVYDRK